jgi:hypothetical protein
MSFQIKPKPNKFLHPTKGWLNEIDTIKYYTSIGKRYPQKVSGWILLFDKELEEVYKENLSLPE